MARKKHAKPHEEEAGEAWLLPYSDLMTLLLALFIALFAMSQTDASKMQATGYALWMPFANKLKIMSEQEVSQKRMIIEGILSLQAGDSPTAIEAKLMVFIPQTEREALKGEG